MSEFPVARRLAGLWRIVDRPWVAIAVAALMLMLVAAPASIWVSPRNDIVQTGFDPVTMYTDNSVGDSSPGSIEMTAGATTITALQGSSSLVHLVTSPMSYGSTFRLRVTRADASSVPVTIAITAPYLGNEFRMRLGAEPTRSITLQRVVNGRVRSETLLGSYAVGETYRVSTKVDRQTSQATLVLASADGQTRGHAMMLADSGAGDFTSHVITDKPIGVIAGKSYSLSADVLPLVTGLVGLSLDWYDAQGHRVDTSSDWRTMSATAPVWLGHSVTAVAPESATSVRPEIALADSGSANITSIDLRRSTTGKNLIFNGRFNHGNDGWRRSEGADPIEVSSFPSQSVHETVDAQSFPGLFKALRMALTVSASSGAGTGQVVLSDYRVTVSHQRWLADLVRDPLVAALVVILGLAGLGLLVRQATQLLRSPYAARLRSRISRPLTLKISRWNTLLAVAVMVYFALSIALSHLGSLNADLIGARVWTYDAGTHGLASLYFEPNISSAEAGQWQGHAFQEAGFPYGPTMAYIFGVLGFIYSFGMHQSALGSPDAISIDFLVRMANAVFGLADVILIALIVRRFGVSLHRAWLVAAIFLLAPALMFADSVWGTTQSMSLVFLLAAIFFMQSRRLTAAWVFVFAACMTRPQNLIAAAVLALILLRTSSIRSTIRALPCAIMIAFVALVPFSLAVAPSLPVDVTVNALFLHVGTGNDAWTLPVSWGAFSPWVILVTIARGVFGVDSILYPATTGLAGGVSFYRAGTITFAVFLIVLIVLVVSRGRRNLWHGNFVLTSTVAVLGLLLLMTGTPSYHMVLPTALSFLLIRAVPRPVYLLSTISLSATTFLSMYGMGAYWLSSHPTWGTGVYDPHFWGAIAMSWAVQNPVIVLAASVANTATFVALFVCLIRRPVTEPRSAQGNNVSIGAPLRRSQVSLGEAQATDPRYDQPCDGAQDDLLIGGRR